MHTRKPDLIMQNRVILWLALATVLVLAIPLVAMQFTSDVVWSLSDFVVAGVLLFGTGFAFVLAARRFRRQRVVIGLALLAVLAYLWVELAVGLVTTWGS